MTPVNSEVILKFESELEQGLVDEATCIAWLKDHGTPLMELREGYEKYLWVTHFYVAPEGVDNVVVYEPHVDFNVERAQMQRIAKSSIFAKTTLVPFNFDLQYAFSVNDTLVLDPFTRGEVVTLGPEVQVNFIKTPLKG